jgi:hypothetical protein
MEKNWLIRTKSNHILGPISKDKILELYHNGSIKPDDEICSGNGYWFFIREDDLVKRYLLGNESQGFNPISEAKNVLIQEDSKPKEVEQRDDITKIGGVNLGQLNDQREQSKHSSVSPPIVEAPAFQEITAKVSEKAEIKKKIKIDQPPIKKSQDKHQLKNQSFLKYLSWLGVLLLFLLIYYRKTLIKSLFSFNVLSPVFAQEIVKKKSINDAEVVIENISFRPHIGLDGFKIKSSFDVDLFECSSLSSVVGQMAIILYPPELLNEKLMIKVRDCMIHLKVDHPVKKWLVYVSRFDKVKPEITDQSFLIEIINSKFNLITDQKIKNKVIKILGDLDEDTIEKIILKSYLHLMTGNITRSDNLLLKIINKPPYDFYLSRKKNHDVISEIVNVNLDKILQKFSRHPADRSIFYLLTEYLKTFTNQNDLGDLLNGVEDEEVVYEKIQLKYLSQRAPEFSVFLKLRKMKSQSYQLELQNTKNISSLFQLEWVWAYLGFPNFYNEDHLSTFLKEEEKNSLWAMYLLRDEKLFELYRTSTSKRTPSQQRQILRDKLQKNETFYLALFKLIEMGDIDESLIIETASHLTR